MIQAVAFANTEWCTESAKYQYRYCWAKYLFQSIGIGFLKVVSVHQ